MQNKNRKISSEWRVKKSQLMELIKLREKFEEDLIAVPNNYTKHFFFYCKLLNSHQNADFHHFS